MKNLNLVTYNQTPIHHIISKKNIIKVAFGFVQRFALMSDDICDGKQGKLFMRIIGMNNLLAQMKLVKIVL